MVNIMTSLMMLLIKVEVLQLGVIMARAAAEEADICLEREYLAVQGDRQIIVTHLFLRVVGAADALEGQRTLRNNY